MVSDGGLRMIDKNEDRWIGIEDAAEYLDVNKDTIRNWIKKWTQTYRHTGQASNGSLKNPNLILG